MGDPIEFEEKRLRTFFEAQSDRFIFEGIIAHGANGVTLKVTELRPTGWLAPAIQPQGRKRKRLRTFSPVEIARAIRRRFSRPMSLMEVLQNSNSRRTPVIPRTVNSPGRLSLEPNPETPRRTMAIKRALGEFGIQPLREEIELLRSINGSLHIVGLLAYRDDPIPVARRLSRFPFPRVPPGQGDFLAGITGPVLAMEYLENGVLRRLIQRLQTRAEPTPNRCLAIRAVVALAYPKGHDPDTSPSLEQIPGPDEKPSLLAHGDLHTNNIMFGGTMPSVAEHRKFPIMKVIDLGFAKESATAITDNLYDISEAIYNLIIREMWNPDLRVRGAKYQDIITHAIRLSDAARPNRNLDSELRDLICRSMAVDVKDRLSLRDMLFRVSYAVENKNEGSFLLNGTAERDEDIQRFLQELIYDADPPPGPPNLDRNGQPPVVITLSS
ncbi:hypothetical protein F4678DRAFT_484137 [Xylaria arbuscula]|nr:hypothetical protein F4678DRAFT_484137 [Xylaria arbuscula]